MATISVVIPLYNKGPFIGNALNSVIGQTIAADQVIVVDDGSTDGGADVVSEYAGRGVELVQQPNQGVSVARNCGAFTATSQYVAFLDADDWWEPDHVETLLRLIQGCPDAGLLSTAHYIKQGGHTWLARSSFMPGWSGIIYDFLPLYAKERTVLHSSSNAVRQNAFMEVGGFPADVRRGEDIITWIKLALKYSVAHIEKPTSVFNKEASSAATEATEVSGALYYLQELLAQDRLPPAQKYGVGKVFDGIGVAMAAGQVLMDRREVAVEIRDLSWRAKRWRPVLGITGLLFAPPAVLRFLRRRRKTVVR